MRFKAAMILFAVVVASVPAVAQQQQLPPRPIYFTEEEWPQLLQLLQKTHEAFNYREYEKALGFVAETREMYTKARQRVENGEVEIPENATKQDVLDAVDNGLQSVWYNTACALSRLGRVDDALDAFQKSMDLGYADVDHVRMDEDLDAIRKDPRFEKMLAVLEYNEEYALHVPEGLTGKAPLLVALHETGAAEKQAIDIFSGLADDLGMVLVAPRAPVTHQKGQFDWARSTDADEAGLKKIAWTIDKAKAEAPVDPSKVYLVGIADGGKFATMYALMHPDAVAGVVSFEGYWNKYYYADFFPKVKEAGLKICLIHAKRTADEVEPAFDRTKAGVDQLTEAGIPARFFGLVWGDAAPEKGDEKPALEEKRKKRRAMIVKAVREALTWMKG